MGYTQLMPIAGQTPALAGAAAQRDVHQSRGARFVNEYAERDVISKAAFANGTLFYELKSLGTATTPESHVVFIADTLDELAAKLGCDPAVLKSEVERYNSFVAQGYDPDFGKTSFTDPIEPPYMARAMKPSIHHTMGGVKIDTDCHVLNKEARSSPPMQLAVTGGIHAGTVGGTPLPTSRLRQNSRRQCRERK